MQSAKNLQIENALLLFAPRKLVALANQLINQLAVALARCKKLTYQRYEMFKRLAFVVGVECHLVVLRTKLGRVIEVFATAELVASIFI